MDKLLYLCDLSEEKDLSKLKNYVERIQLDDIFDNIRKEAEKGNPTIVTILRAIFRGSSSCDDASVVRRKKIYVKIVNLLQEVEVTSRLASDLIGLLLMETDALPSDFLPKVISDLTQIITAPGPVKCRQIFDLIPKVICSLASRRIVMYDDNQISGQECKVAIIEKLCSLEWSTENTVMIASFFREIPLTSAELQKVIDKLIKNMSDMQVQEVPPLIYQLLLLGAQGLREHVLKLVIEYFNDQDEKVSKEEQDVVDLTSLGVTAACLLHIEGTVILHITYAAKQDQELGKEFVKLLKSSQHIPGYILTPFTVALALSLARIMHYGDQIVDLLKAVILRHFRESEKMSESFWVRQLLPEKVDRSLVILEAVENSKSGWDHVSQGFVQLGFILLDTYGPKAYFGKAVDNACEQKPASASQCACALGSKIIEQIFKISSNVRSEIIEQLINRILTKASAPVSHYVSILTNTVQSVPQFYLGSLDRIQEVVESLPFLSYSTSVMILSALTPLVKISVALKDNLMVVLRKALFHRNIEARKISVASFLMVLKNFRILGGIPLSQSSYVPSPMPSSQIQVDVHSKYNNKANEVLCLELLSIVKRSLVQQADVRQVLYNGLPRVLEMNPHLSSAIMGLLLTQFKLYYEQDEDVAPPLKLDACIQAQGDQWILTEPIAALILSVQKCIVACIEQKHASADSEDDVEIADYNFSKLHKMMNSLVRRMAKAELEDFELDKSALFNSSNSIGAKNQMLSGQLLQIYQILIEYCFMVVKDSVDSYQNMLTFYEHFQKLTNIIKEKSSGEKEGKGRKGIRSSTKPVHAEQNVISLKCLSELLEKIFCHSSPEEQTAIACLAKHNEFTSFLLTLTNQQINSLQEVMHNKNIDKMFKFCCRVGKTFASKIFPYSSLATQPTQERSIIQITCLEGMINLLTFVDTLSKQKFLEFLIYIDKDKKNLSNESEITVILHNIKKFQDVILKYLSRSDKEQKLKEVIPLLNAIGLLSKYVTNEDNLKAVYNWVKDLCSQQAINDIAVVKTLLSLCLKLSRQGKDYPIFVNAIAEDLHNLFGDIDEDVQLPTERSYAIISSKTGSSVCSLLLNSMDQILEEIDWVLTYLRSTVNTFAKQTTKFSLSSAQRNVKENSLCSRCGHLITAFNKLTQAKLPLGSCTDITIKLLTKFYNTITLFVKYFIVIYTQKIGNFCSRFEKLTKLLGSDLTPQVYSMIIYILGTGQESLDKTPKSGQKSKPSSAAKRAKIDKEPKLIPSLIFTIEQYERYLLQLSKKSKVDLMQYIKLSTSRDFRINLENARAATQNQPDESEDSDNNESE